MAPGEALCSLLLHIATGVLPIRILQLRHSISWTAELERLPLESEAYEISSSLSQRGLGEVSWAHTIDSSTSARSSTLIAISRTSPHDDSTKEGRRSFPMNKVYIRNNSTRTCPTPPSKAAPHVAPCEQKPISILRQFPVPNNSISYHGECCHWPVLRRSMPCSMEKIESQAPLSAPHPAYLCSKSNLFLSGLSSKP